MGSSSPQSQSNPENSAADTTSKNASEAKDTDIDADGDLDRMQNKSQQEEEDLEDSKSPAVETESRVGEEEKKHADDIKDEEDGDGDDLKLPADNNSSISVPESHHPEDSKRNEESNDGPSSEKEEEEDSKPAAKDTSKDRDDDDDDDSSSSSSSSSSSDDSSEDDEEEGTDDHALSEYEIQRLERIKRNREYLAQLGLEGKEGGGVLGGKKKVERTRKPRNKEEVQQRHSMSRRTKEKKSYVEPSNSVRALLNDSGKIGAKKRKKVSMAVAVASTTTADGTDAVDTSAPPAKKKRKAPERMEQFIYHEFGRIRSGKNQSLKQAERNVRAAEKEVNYWKRLAVGWEKKQQRKLEAKRQKLEDERMKKLLGGKSLKEFLQDLDSRMPEIQEAVKRYDDSLQVEEREYENEVKRFEAEQKMKILDAIDRVPKAMKNATSLLNTALLERAPKDPPPPRRSRRSAADTEEDHDAESSSPTKKPANSRKSQTVPVSPTSDDDNARLEDVVPMLNLSPSAEDVGSASTEKPGNVKQRKRNVRNVGGWISPQFSKEVDRSWLMVDSPPEKFDLSTYVPQVGDTVLYFISGHRLYLEQYPDVLGKKTRSKTRLPLWEKAMLAKEELQESVDNLSQETSPVGITKWWSEEWLEGLESKGYGDYPLLCRVERTHAEFPPDPFCKVVKKDDRSDGTTVFFKRPKGYSGNASTDRVQMRLAVSLRPLTTFLPPGCSENSLLDIPPAFTVVTFPSKLDPFLVPFAWAYSMANSLSLNQKVVVLSGDATKVRVDRIATLGERFPIASVLEKFDNAPSKNEALEKELETHIKDLPLRDARVVLDVLYRFQSKQKPQESLSEMTVGFVDALRSTLPLWKSVTIMRTMYDRKKTKFSPWCLATPGKAREFASPWNIGDHVYGLDEALRLKTACLLEDFASANAAASELFYEMVTEELAPSYYCAVPVGMSLSRIVQRLQVKGAGKEAKCLYRSVDAIIADVASILDCCLLYNSPDADIVVQATSVVAQIKEKITQIAQNHYREFKEARKVDDERRRLVLQQAEANGSEDSPKRSTVINTLRNPFKDSLYREWLEKVRQEPDQQSSGLATGETVPSWVPQAGDKILYSRELHSQFIKEHYKSLEPHQCVTLSSGAGCAASDGDWVRGNIVWTRSSFPKALSKRSGEDSNTFLSTGTLLTLGIKLERTEEVSVLDWRPCVFDFEHASVNDNVCPACGLSLHESFLRMATKSSSEVVEAPGDQENHVAAGTLSADLRQSIDKCFNLLKRRCLREVPPAYVDPQLTKDSVKSGFRVSLAKIGVNSLPQFENLFSDVRERPGPTNAHGTRGISLKPLKEDPSVSLLIEAGFLPIWAPASLTTEKVESQQLRRFETLLPAPKLCLELIQLRLRSNYYRQKAAIESDLVEAYQCTVFSLLAEAASRKKSPVSVKRIARALATNKETSVQAVASKPGTTQVEEETAWVERLRKVRELYAAALISVSDTGHTERIFGLINMVAPQKPKSFEVQKQSPAQIDARQKLGYLLTAIGRDECLNRFNLPSGNEWSPSLPLINVKVICGRRLVTHEREISPLSAQFSGKPVKVKIRCEGEIVAFDENVSEASNDDQPSGPSSRNKPRIKVAQSAICFGPEDYEANDSLSKLLFSRPGRSDACARCRVFQRSMLACRVSRKHSNVDFDWIVNLKGGIGRIDELLATLFPEDSRELAAVTNADGEVDDSATNGANVASNKLLVSELSGQSNDAEADADEDVSEHCGDEEQTVDPVKAMQKADGLLSMSREVLEEAAAYAQTPARLSREFITNAFPIDESDGHYLYCVVCGLSGNLLCCDGCPNVVHSECVGLNDLPEGDWFCEECKGSPAQTDKEKPGRGPLAPDSNTPKITVSATDRPAFGRAEFSTEGLDRVTAQLEELRSSRPTQKVKKAASEDIKGDGYGNNDVEADDTMKGEEAETRPDPDTCESVVSDQMSPRRMRGRPRKNVSIDSVAEDTSKQKRRGRPRKRSSFEQNGRNKDGKKLERDQRSKDDNRTNTGQRRKKRRRKSSKRSFVEESDTSSIGSGQVPTRKASSRNSKDAGGSEVLSVDSGSSVSRQRLSPRRRRRAPPRFIDMFKK